MAKKFYVVWAGREPGIFTDWASCKRSVDKFAGARYKSFPTRAEAEAAYGSGGAGASRAAGGRPSTKKPSTASGGGSITSASQIGGTDIAIFCDGGCDPNPGHAGSGVAVYQAGALSQLWYGLYNPRGTNNTAELNALHQSLLLAEKAISEGRSVAIYCDSMYSINCISVWAYGWKKKGWKKSTGEIKNLEMIQDIHGLYDRIKSGLTLKHVKAHIGVEGNELADRMTMVAVDEKEPTFKQYEQGVDVSALLKMRAG